MFALFVTACADHREVNGRWLRSGRCRIELPPSSRLPRSHLRHAEPPEIATLARPAQNADVFPVALSFPSPSSLDVIGISLTFAAPLDKHCAFRRLVALQGYGIYPAVSMAEATRRLGRSRRKSTTLWPRSPTGPTRFAPSATRLSGGILSIFPRTRRDCPMPESPFLRAPRLKVERRPGWPPHTGRESSPGYQRQNSQSETRTMRLRSPDRSPAAAAAPDSAATPAVA